MMVRIKINPFQTEIFHPVGFLFECSPVQITNYPSTIKYEPEKNLKHNWILNFQ